MPDRIQHGIPTHNAATIADQKFQKIEDLRLDGYNGSSTTEFTPPCVQDAIVEDENHPQPSANANA